MGDPKVRENPFTFADIVKGEWEVDEYGYIKADDDDGWIGAVYNMAVPNEKTKRHAQARLIANAPAMYRTLKAVVSPDDFVATKTIVALLNRIEGKEVE